MDFIFSTHIPFLFLSKTPARRQSTPKTTHEMSPTAVRRLWVWMLIIYILFFPFLLSYIPLDIDEFSFPYSSPNIITLEKLNWDWLESRLWVGSSEDVETALSQQATVNCGAICRLQWVFFSRPLVHETTLLFSSSFWMNASMEYKHNQARKKLISLLRSTISAFVWGEFVAVACLLLLLLLLLCFITRMKMVMIMMTTCLYSIADVTAKVDTLCGPKGKRRAIEMEKRNIYIINSFFRPFQFAEQSSLIIHLFSCDQGSLSVRLAVCKRSSVCMKSFVEHYSNC